MKTYVFTLVAAVGLLTACDRTIESASEDFNTLPPAVQKAVRAQAPDAEIASVDSRSENGLQVYEIEFRESGINPNMVIAADGRVLNSPGTEKLDGVMDKVEKALTPTGAVGTRFSALPQRVQETIQTKAPATEIADINRSEDNGRVIYEVEFRDEGKKPSIKIAEDGTLVQDLR